MVDEDGVAGPALGSWGERGRQGAKVLAFGVRWCSITGCSDQLSRAGGFKKRTNIFFNVLVCGEGGVCFLGGVETAPGFLFWGAARLMTKSCHREMPSRRRTGRENLVWEAECVRTALKKQKHVAADGLQKTCSLRSQS